MPSSFALTSLWEFLRVSSVMQLYLLSMLLLASGMAYDIWVRGVRISNLDNVSLKIVEFTHPHIPSLRRVLAIAGCTLSFLAAALSLTSGLWPLQNPDLWITISVACLIAGALAVLAELRSAAGRKVVLAAVLCAACTLALLVRSALLV
jgi:hypothetical protein